MASFLFDYDSASIEYCSRSNFVDLLEPERRELCLRFA